MTDSLDVLRAKADSVNPPTFRSEKTFDPGQIVATPGALEFRHLCQRSLARHLRKDWGDVCPFDWTQNEYALETGERLLSSYHYPEATILVITEADRSATTILLPEEY